MEEAYLEHVNLTVSNPRSFAELLTEIFGWRIRWSGIGKDSGEVYHVGGENSYVAVYSLGGSDKPGHSYTTPGAMNHLGVVVDDLDSVEAKVAAAGYTPRSHAEYEPGRRFYFDGPDEIEIEVISYR